VLNLHPSLLPAYPGLDAIRRAFDDRAGVTGCTVHVVTADIDAGPIVLQSEVSIRDGDTLDTLTRRVHDAEHALYPDAVRRYFGEPHRIEHGRVVFDGAGSAT
jgi:phosphoribosylglycinamide formyltransferase-1